MRTIPAHIQDPELKKKLETLSQRIQEGMKQVEQLKTKMKSGKMSSDDLAQLKTLGNQIHSLDQEWKNLAQS